MRTIITETTAFKFNELTEEGQEKAIEGLWDINVDYEWWDFTYEDAENIGLKIEGFDIDRGAYCEGKFIGDALECAEKIVKEHGETCGTYADARAYLKERADIEQHAVIDEWGQFDLKTDDKLDALTNEFLKSLLEDYRIQLRENYDYYTGREAVIETINANEYEFTREGNLI